MNPVIFVAVIGALAAGAAEIRYLQTGVSHWAEVAYVPGTVAITWAGYNLRKQKEAKKLADTKRD